MDALTASRYEMIEAGGRTAQDFGMNRLLGQIYMLLFMSPEPVSLQSIGEQLNVSKASASIACRQLESFGAVRKAWIIGDRKDYYEAETDLGSLLGKGVLDAVNKKINSARHQIERSLDFLEQSDTDKEVKQFVKDRLELAEKYRSRVDKLINNPIVKKLI